MEEANQSLETQEEVTYTESQPEPTEEESEETREITEEAVPETETPPEKEPETETPPVIKVKYNHEEKEIPFGEATTLIQKGLNYDKVDSRLRERDAEVARRFGSQGITTWDQLISGWDAALRAKEAENLDRQYQTLVKQEAERWGADPDRLLDVVKNLATKHPSVLEAERLRQENSKIRTEAQIQTRVNQDAASFKKAYPDVDVSTIPDEVWERVNAGYSLMDSYQIHENQLLKAKIAEQEKAITVKETNLKNAASSPGSVTGQGATAAAAKSAWDMKQDDFEGLVERVKRGEKVKF